MWVTNIQIDPDPEIPPESWLLVTVRWNLDPDRYTKVLGPRIHTGSMLITLFQGEMGSEGLRGLPGESGNKGAKVRFISPLLNFNLSLGIIIFTCSPSLHRETTAFQGPEEHLEHLENLEETWVKIHI